MELLYKEILTCGVQYKIFHLKQQRQQQQQNYSYFIVEKFCACNLNGEDCFCFGSGAEDKSHLFWPSSCMALEYFQHPWKLLENECMEEIENCHFTGPISRLYKSWQDFHRLCEIRCPSLSEAVMKARAACFISMFDEQKKNKK